jgi:hypothetical protein
VNGALAAQVTHPIDTAIGTDLVIGQSPNAEVAWPTTEMAGFVDELTVYDRALSAAEVQAIYAAGAAGKR